MTNPQQQPTPIAMDTEEETSTSSQSPPVDLPVIIKELKMEIATITTEFRTTLQSLLPSQVNTTLPSHLVK